MIKIDWSRILTNAVSAIVVAILIGAGTIIWVGVTTIDEKINTATSTLEKQAAYLVKAVDVIQSEMVKDREHRDSIVKMQQDIIAQVDELTKDALNNNDLLPQILNYGARIDAPGSAEGDDEESEVSVGVYERVIILDPDDMKEVPQIELHTPSQLEQSPDDFIQRQLPMIK